MADNHESSVLELAEAALQALGTGRAAEVADAGLLESLARSGQAAGGVAAQVQPPAEGDRPVLSGDLRAQRLVAEFAAVKAEIRVALLQGQARLTGLLWDELQSFTGEVLRGDVGGGEHGVRKSGPPVNDARPAGSSTPARPPIAAPPVSPARPERRDEGMGKTQEGKQPVFHASVQVAVQDEPTALLQTEPGAGLPAADVSHAPEGAEQRGEDELYQGTVRLNLRVEGCVRQMLGLVNKLCQRRQIRLVRLVGDHKGGLDVWVGLREPVCMKKLLLGMEGVAGVNDVTLPGEDSEERQLEVWLRDARDS